MARHTFKKRTLTPWYHQPMPRCITLTVMKERCSYSARYVDPTGRITVCKIHADMMPDINFKRIKVDTINIYESGIIAEVIPFRSA